MQETMRNVVAEEINEIIVDMDPAGAIRQLLPSGCGQCEAAAESLQWWLYDPRLPSAQRAAAFILESHKPPHTELV